MAKTITLDRAELREVRITTAPTGDPIVQVSFDLLAKGVTFQTVNLRNVTAELTAAEVIAAQTLLGAMGALLERVELS